MAWQILADGNYAVANNNTYTIPIQFHNASGGLVTDPDTLAAATTGAHAASMSATMTTTPDPSGGGGTVPAVMLAALVIESDAGNAGGGIGLTITDTTNPSVVEDSASMGVLFDIVNPALVATGLSLDIPGVVVAANPNPPTAAGP